MFSMSACGIPTYRKITYGILDYEIMAYDIITFGMTSFEAAFTGTIRPMNLSSQRCVESDRYRREDGLFLVIQT